MGNQTNNQKVTKFTMKTFFAATLAASAVAGDEAIRARWSAQRDIASMARDLEDCFPTGQLGNSVWRPTTIVKPGRVWAEAGQGPASRVDCDGKEVGESRLVFPTYKKGATTRTAGYSYDRTLLETRQPARCSYGYAMPYYGCTYGYGCGYQQPSYGCGGKTVDARGYGECKECEDYPRGMAYPECYNTCDTSYDEEEYVPQADSAYRRVDFPAPEYSYDVDASVAVPQTIYDLIGAKPASLASIPSVQQRGSVAPAPVYDLTKKNVKYPDFDACAQAQKFDTYGCSPCPEPQEPTYEPVDEQHYGASFPAPVYGYHVDADVPVPHRHVDIMGVKDTVLADVPDVVQRGPIAPAPVYEKKAYTPKEYTPCEGFPTQTYCSEMLGCGYKRGLGYGCGQTYGSAFKQGPAGVPVKRNPYPYVPAGYEAEGDYNWQGTVHDQPSQHGVPVGRYNWTFNDFKYAKNGILDVNGRKGYAKFYECEGEGCPDCKDQTGTLLQDLLNRIRKDDCKDCDVDYATSQGYY